MPSGFILALNNDISLINDFAVNVNLQAFKIVLVQLHDAVHVLFRFDYQHGVFFAVNLR
ncbi:hypothetical protein D3C71_2249420 [compost metagenome]